MTWSLVTVLTAVPILPLTWYGYRAGVRRLSVAMAGVVIAGGLGGVVAYVALRGGWFEPIGLLSPLCLGAVAALLGRRPLRALLGKVAGGRGGSPPRVPQRIAGAALGAGAGILAAADLWLAFMLVQGTVTVQGTVPGSPAGRRVAAGARPPGEALVPALLRTAHRGFLRHLPWIGATADEIEAVTFIFQAPCEAREELVRRRGWQDIGDLPAFQAILEEPDLLADIARAGSGDLLAIFRLQSHPLVLALSREERVWDVVSRTRPTALARELAEIERDLLSAYYLRGERSQRRAAAFPAAGPACAPRAFPVR